MTQYKIIYFYNKLTHFTESLPGKWLFNVGALQVQKFEEKETHFSNYKFFLRL